MGIGFSNKYEDDLYDENLRYFKYQLDTIFEEYRIKNRINNIKLSESTALSMNNEKYKVTILMSKDDHIMIEMEEVTTKLKYRSDWLGENGLTFMKIPLSVMDIYHTLVNGIQFNDKKIKLNCFSNSNNIFTFIFRWTVNRNFVEDLLFKLSFVIKPVKLTDSEMRRLVRELNIKCNKQEENYVKLEKEFDGLRRELGVFEMKNEIKTVILDVT